MKDFLKSFKKFITRGNVIDMAVGVVIGGAFSKIVNSLVNDIIMPLIAWAIGDVAFTDLSIVLKEAILGENGEIIKSAITWNYGSFIQAIINFLIIALCIFTTIYIIGKIKAKTEKIAEELKNKHRDENAEEAVVEEATPEVPVTPQPTTEDLLKEIRDLLADKKQETPNDVE